MSFCLLLPLVVDLLFCLQSLVGCLCGKRNIAKIHLDHFLYLSQNKIKPCCWVLNL